MAPNGNFCCRDVRHYDSWTCTSATATCITDVMRCCWPNVANEKNQRTRHGESFYSWTVRQSVCLSPVTPRHTAWWPVERTLLLNNELIILLSYISNRFFSTSTMNTAIRSKPWLYYKYHTLVFDAGSCCYCMISDSHVANVSRIRCNPKCILLYHFWVTRGRHRSDYETHFRMKPQLVAGSTTGRLWIRFERANVAMWRIML